MAAKKKPATNSRVRRMNAGKNHWYKIDGEKADGVTTLLGDGMRKKALEAWGSNTTAQYAVDHWDELAELSPTKRYEELKGCKYAERDAAAKRGTEVHALAESLSRGEEVEVPEEIAGHVQSMIRFMDDFQIEVIVMERPVYHVAGNYAGTFDVVFRSRLFPGAVVLGDYKTSRSGIYGETALQLEAYSRADAYFGEDGEDHPMSELGITEHWAIWIRSDGYTVYRMAKGDDVFRTFQYVAEVARRTEGKNRPLDALKGAEVTPPVVES